MWWTALITNQMAMPTDPPHYHLLSKESSRIKYGVDHSAYMSTLAKDFGGAPGLRELYMAHGLKVLLVYCFGASFVTFYRLVGPFKSDVAPEITKTELAETILRRGIILGNLFFGVSSEPELQSDIICTDIITGDTNDLLRFDQLYSSDARDGWSDTKGEAGCMSMNRLVVAAAYHACTALPWWMNR